jgi:hypothetical protein
MTEEDWIRGLFVEPMLDWLPETLLSRKLQLFAVACCRAHWDVFPAEPCRQTVNVAERFADGTASLDELTTAITACERHVSEVDYSAPAWAAHAAADCGRGAPATHAKSTASSACCAAFAKLGANSGYWDRGPDPHEYEQVKLLHEVIGNPFRPARLERSWLTSDVLALSERAYKARQFSLLPVLADALEDAGCEDADILDHCRGRDRTSAAAGSSI